MERKETQINDWKKNRETEEFNTHVNTKKNDAQQLQFQALTLERSFIILNVSVCLSILHIKRSTVLAKQCPNCLSG